MYVLASYQDWRIWGAVLVKPYAMKMVEKKQGECSKGKKTGLRKWVDQWSSGKLRREPEKQESEGAFQYICAMRIARQSLESEILHFRSLLSSLPSFLPSLLRLWSFQSSWRKSTLCMLEWLSGQYKWVINEFSVQQEKDDTGTKCSNVYLCSV